MTDTVLIVDDEESVRRTFQEWLVAALPSAKVFAAADAETALKIANEHAVDLAVLDWNLGSGSDGLRLLEDLVEFRPDVVARSEEHTSELQSLTNLVCRLLLEKKKKKKNPIYIKKKKKIS